MQATLVALAAEKRTAKAISQAIGVSRNAVIGRARRTGVKLAEPRVAQPKPPRVRREPQVGAPSLRRAHNAARREAVRERYIAGDRLIDISCLTGVAIGSIPSYVKDLPRRRAVSWNTARRSEDLRLEVMVALLSGTTHRQAAPQFGVSVSSITIWRRDADLVAKARPLADEIIAERKRVAAERTEAARQAAQDRADLIAEINAPILASMPQRHREIVNAYLDRRNFQAAAEPFGLTRDRVRQIVGKWRLRGLIVDGAPPLSGAAVKTFNTSDKRGRPRKPRKPVDFWAEAHAMTSKKSRNYSAAERERRAQQMRDTHARRRGEAVH